MLRAAPCCHSVRHKQARRQACCKHPHARDCF
jgi:hypothetical protein